MVLPPVVAGIALRTAFGRSGAIGEPLLDATGFAFPYTTWGVVLAHVFVAMPFVVISIEGALRSAGRSTTRRRPPWAPRGGRRSAG